MAKTRGQVAFKPGMGSTVVPRYPVAKPRPIPKPKPPNLSQIAAQYVPGGRYGTNTSRYPVSVITPPGYTNPYAGPGVGGDGGAPEYQPPAGRWVTPDYSGILGSFTADARARFGAGLESKKAGRLSEARAIINRLGVRDIPGMLSKLGQYGLTEADLRGAAENPWSELRALEQTGRSSWANAVANRAARGGYRSGGTIGARQRIDEQLARQEALLTQEALGGLSEGLRGQVDWEREERDRMEQAIAQQQASLAAAYQPYWMQG